MGFRLSPTAAAVGTAFAAPVPDPLAGLLEPIDASDVLSLEIAHVDTLDQIASGRGDAQTLWDWVANVLTWSRAADLTSMGQEEMGFQLQICLDLIARWKRTGRVGFDGPGLQLARYGVQVMDALAREVDQYTARQAALWSEEQLALMRAEEEGKVA